MSDVAMGYPGLLQDKPAYSHEIHAVRVSPNITAILFKLIDYIFFNPLYFCERVYNVFIRFIRLVNSLRLLD